MAETASEVRPQRDAGAAHEHVNVLIVGAGISGIGMAVHLQRDAPGKSFAIVERRDNLGGTWDLFRYPGVRSDSDMHTLGYVFEPWTEQKAIADGPSILDYLNRIVDKHDVRRRIRFGNRVLSADWDSATARWTVAVERGDGARATMTANWLFMGAGYYDYDQPYDAPIPGLDAFEGEVVHPQFWPGDLDLTGKRAVVIGSGATAVTIVPNIAGPGPGRAAHVTMLQRTPTWYFVRDAEDKFANFLRKLLGEETAYKIIRKKNVWLQDYAFRMARKKPEKLGEKLHKPIRDFLGERFDAKDYTPPYGPWEQRLCLVPDNDLFEAIKRGDVELVTDHIEEVRARSIRLKSGREIDADVIVTATGLKLAVAGKVAFTVDGRRIEWPEQVYYKGCMFANIPNMAVVFGYLNASWTLKADIVSTFVCRLLNEQDRRGAAITVPRLPDPNAIELEKELFDFSSGYIKRAVHTLPRNGRAMPWRLNQDYLFDKKLLTGGPIDDGALRFEKAGALDLGDVPPIRDAVEEEEPLAQAAE